MPKRAILANKRSCKRGLLVYCLLVLAIFPLKYFCHAQTAGFSIARVCFTLPRCSSEEALPVMQLDQTFSFMSRGGQSFAFLSEDGQYILKLLNRHRAPIFLLHWPLPQRIKDAVRKRIGYVEKKWRRDSASYLLAHQQLKEESGLLCVHLEHTDTLHKRIKIYDKLGIAHTIDLDATAFILQKRAEPLLSYLKALIQAQNLERAKAALQQVVELIAARCNKGIIDEDTGLHKNIGFIDQQPIFIDVGRFKQSCAAVNLHQELIKMTHKLRVWLSQECPELANHLAYLVALR